MGEAAEMAENRSKRVTLALDKETESDVFTLMKAWGILFVVAGHTMIPSIHDFVYLFHLAVFYFIAGYFFKDKYTGEKWNYFLKRVKRLWLPLAGYGVVFLLLHNLLFRLHIYSPEYDHLYTAPDYLLGVRSLLTLNTYAGNLLGALWFIQSLFFVSLLFLGCLWLAQKISTKHSEIVFASLIVLLTILSHSVLYGRITAVSNLLGNIVERDFAILPILYAGRLCRRWREHIPLHWAWLLVTFGVLVIAQLAGIKLFIGGIRHTPLAQLPLLYLVSLTGCYFTLLLSFLSLRIGKRNFLFTIGKYTLEIMALHFLAFKIVSLIQIGVYSYDIERLADFPVISERIALWAIPYVLAGVLLPLGWVWLREQGLRIWRTHRPSFAGIDDRDHRTQ